MLDTNDRSIPNFFDFDPRHIPFQTDVILDMENEFDYSLGAHDVLLSGSVGSAKSLLMAHLAVKHCLLFPKAKIIMGRLSLPDIKRTIFPTICEHLSGDERLVEGKDWFMRETTADIWFSNGSELVPVTWQDKKWKRIHSINASAAIIEELTENDDVYKKGFFSIKQRVGRLPHVPHKWVLSATNPDSPRHWAYKYFIEPINNGKAPRTRHVYYSRTEDNPFLPVEYIRQLREDLDPKEALRQLEGQWIEIDQERIYHSYNGQKQFHGDLDYSIRDGFPIYICFDFNIAAGKPMSSCAYQFINDTFHVFDERIVHGARTQDVMDEWADSGILTKGNEIVVHGDATGKHRDTRSILSDYDIIRKFLSNIPGLRFRMEVPIENPPIRARHNRVNAYCLNDLGQTRLYVYKKAKTVDEGLRLTALKPGANYVEDDSKSFQHVTTALGYGIYYDTNRSRAQVTSQRR